MFIISKTIKGKEFIYSTKYSILCRSRKQAEQLADFLNKNNKNTIEDFRLKKDETWWVYEIDKYDTLPKYKLVTTKNEIKVVEL